MEVEWEYSEKDVKNLIEEILKKVESPSVKKAVENAIIIPAFKTPKIRGRDNWSDSDGEIEVVEKWDLKFEEDRVEDYDYNYYVFPKSDVEPIVVLKVELPTYEDYELLMNVLEELSIPYCGLTCVDYILYVPIPNSHGIIIS